MFRYCCSAVNARLISRGTNERRLFSQANEQGLILALKMQALLRGSALGQVAASVPFDQRIEFLRQILGMVARPFEGLRHQEDLEGGSVLLAAVISEMFLEQSMTDMVELGIDS